MLHYLYLFTRNDDRIVQHIDCKLCNATKSINNQIKSKIKRINNNFYYFRTNRSQYATRHAKRLQTNKQTNNTHSRCQIRFITKRSVWQSGLSWLNIVTLLSEPHCANGECDADVSSDTGFVSSCFVVDVDVDEAVVDGVALLVVLLDWFDDVALLLLLLLPTILMIGDADTVLIEQK